MNDKEFIKNQAEKIVELSEQLIEEQRSSCYKDNLSDSLANEINSLANEIKEAEIKIEALKTQLEAEKEHGQRLLDEFSRALEVIRGNNLAFESPLIEAEHQRLKYYKVTAYIVAFTLTYCIIDCLLFNI